MSNFVSNVNEIHQKSRLAVTNVEIKSIGRTTCKILIINKEIRDLKLVITEPQLHVQVHEEKSLNLAG